MNHIIITANHSYISYEHFYQIYVQLSFPSSESSTSFNLICILITKHILVRFDYIYYFLMNLSEDFIAITIPIIE